MVTGGYNGFNFLSSSEIYDLNTNEWKEFLSILNLIFLIILYTTSYFILLDLTSERSGHGCCTNMMFNES